MLNKEIGTNKIRNGNILTGHTESMNGNGQLIQVPQLYWIRARTSEPNVLDRIVKCEDITLKVYHFPTLSILEGQYDQITFEGVFSPRELRRYLKEIGSELSTVDPREIHRNRARLLQPEGRIGRGYYNW